MQRMRDNGSGVVEMGLKTGTLQFATIGPSPALLRGLGRDMARRGMRVVRS